MKAYRIILGSFKLPDGSVLQRGERIELEDDVAAFHAERIELLADEAGDEPAEPPVDVPEA